MQQIFGYYCKENEACLLESAMVVLQVTHIVSQVAGL